MEPKIVQCEIGPYPNPRDPSTWDKTPVTVTWDDGSEEVLFRFYSDELSFRREELIGLTRRQAHELFHRKDVTYLRS